MTQAKKVFSPLGATSHSKDQIRGDHDYYATPPIATQALLGVEDFDRRILEPCCGEGHISKVLESQGHRVFSYDLVDRGYGEGGKNFLQRTKPFKGDIITNPPYSLALPFINKALDLIGEGSKIAFLLKLGFLSGKSRQTLWKTAPPRRIYVFTTRIRCGRNGDLSKVRGGAVDFAWFVWEKGYEGPPEIYWLYDI